MFEGRKRRKEITRLEEEMHIARLTAAKALFESANLGESIQSNYADPDPDEAEWSPIYTKGSAGRALTGSTHETMRKEARTLALTNPHARGVLRSLVKFIRGQGFQFKLLCEDAVIKASADDYWYDFCRKNKWVRREREIIHRTFRDGECFIRFFDNDRGTDVRFVDPNLIGAPPEKVDVSDGIFTQSDDAETVLGYYVKSGYNESDAKLLTAAEMQHIKINVDSDVMRGISQLWCIRRRLRQYDTWLQDRLVLNKIRTAIAMVRSWEAASPDQLLAFAESQKTETKTDSKTGDSYRSKMIHPGSIVDVPAGMTLEFKSPNVDARDVAVDGRAILLSVSVGAGPPEYMVTGDTSQANYASTMVSESNGVREFQDWQQVFGEEFHEIWWRVIEHGMRLDEVKKQVRNYKLQVVGPSMIARKPFDDARAGQILSQHGVMSRETWAAREGLNYPEEMRRMAADEYSIQAGGKPPDADEEEEPEEEA